MSGSRCQERMLFLLIFLIGVTAGGQLIYQVDFLSHPWQPFLNSPGLTTWVSGKHTGTDTPALNCAGSFHSKPQPCRTSNHCERLTALHRNLNLGFYYFFLGIHMHEPLLYCT